MTLQASGAISFANIATELAVSSTNLNLNQSNVRTLAAVPSGQISMSNFYGKSNADPVPDAVNWSDISGASPGSNPTLTITGTNITITLRLALTSPGFGPFYESGSGTSTLSIGPVVNGVAQTSINYDSLGGGATTVDFSAPIGATVYFTASVSHSDGLGGAASGSGGGTLTVSNQSNGGAVLDTFSVSVST